MDTGHTLTKEEVRGAVKLIKSLPNVDYYIPAHSYIWIQIKYFVRGFLRSKYGLFSKD